MLRINQIVATIYKTFIHQGLDIPYFRAIMTFVFSVFLHVVQIALLFELPSRYILPFNSPNRTIRWFQTALFFVVLFTICSLIFPKKKLDQQEISDNSILKAKKIIPWYFVGTILLMTGLGILHGVRKGTIHF